MRSIVIIVIVGLLASGVFVFFGHPTSGPDATQYDRIGYNIVSGNGYSLDEHKPFSPTMFREPAYPFFLALIYGIFGHTVMPVLLVQMVLHTATALLTYLIAREVFSQQMAFISGLLVAFFPTLANTAAYLLSETLFTFMLCLGVLLFITAFKRQRLLPYVVAALALALATLTKAATLLLPAVLIIAAGVITAARREGMKKTAVGLLLFGAVFCITVSGWVARNVIVFNTPSLALRSGEALWSRAQKLDDPPKVVAATACYSVSEFLGNKLFPTASEKPERFLFKDFDKAEVLRAGYTARGLTNIQIDDIFRKEAIRKIMGNPAGYIGYTAIEAIKMTAFTYLPFLNEVSVHDYFRTIKRGALILSGLKAVARLMAYVLLVLAFIGIVKHIHVWGGWFFIVTTVCYFNIIYSLLDAIGRYAVPLIPFYCIMAAAAFFPSLARVKR